MMLKNPRGEQRIVIPCCGSQQGDRPAIRAVLGDLRGKLQPFYSEIGRPSIDPELMMRMLMVGYCYGIRFERKLCEEVELSFLTVSTVFDTRFTFIWHFLCLKHCFSLFAIHPLALL
jgi:Transposase domain (DUF772)